MIGRRSLVVVASVVAGVVLGASPTVTASVPLTSRSFIVIQPTTGDVVAQRNPSTARPIASTTKMMTALLTIEHARPGDTFRVAKYRLSPGESTANLPPGARMRVADLLRALLLPSANEAAVTLAVGISGSQKRFVALMNRRARQLGLRHTHYGNPIGLDVGSNHSSPRDLVRLAQAMRTKPFLKTTMNMRRATLRSGPVGRVVVNSNSLVRGVKWVNGVKTGHTARAGYVLVASGTRYGVPVISAVLNAPTEEIRNRDSLTLLRYAASRYRNALVVRKGHRIARVGLAHRHQTVGLVASRSVRRVIRRGERTTTIVIGVPKEIDGPLRRGTRRGTMVIRYRGRTVDRVALVTEHTVPAATLDEKVDDVIPGGLTTIAIVIGIGGGGTLLVVGVRRRRRRRADRKPRTGPTRQETGVA